MKIAIAGLGYVGTANGILLSLKHDVVAIDIDQKKVDLLNEKKSPIDNEDVAEYLSKHRIKFTATNSNESAYSNADYIIIATPTNYNDDKKGLDISSVEDVIRVADKINHRAIFIIKSTLPIGYTEKISQSFSDRKIIFVPEFLRTCLVSSQ